MDPLSLPLDYTVIEHILPHRYPFLLVDRVTELEPDKRIVGIKNVSLNERYLVTSARRASCASPDDPDGVHRSGGRDPDSVQAREPRTDSSVQRHRTGSVQTTGLCGRCRRDRSAGQEPAKPGRSAPRVRARERTRGRRWHDDVRARADGSRDARRDAALDDAPSAVLRPARRCDRAPSLDRARHRPERSLPSGS